MNNVEILAPITGQLIALSSVKDNVFSREVMGKGFAIIPTGQEIVAPVDGEVIALQGHAFGIKQANGLEVLTHVGLETVTLNGKPYSWSIKVGEMVHAGDVIGHVDLAQIAAANLDATTMVVMTNTDDVVEHVNILSQSTVNMGQSVAKVTLKKVQLTEAASPTGSQYEKLAADIIAGVGGKQNVVKVIHCITRLRFYLKNHELADDQGISQLNGVAGVNYAESLGQYQVVIGPAVTDVYDEVISQLGDGVADDSAKSNNNTDSASKNPIIRGFQAIIGTITGSMMPIIGLLAAGGMLNGFLSLFSNKASFPAIYFIDPASSTFTILQSMAMAPFYFLPILVGFSAAQQLKSDPFVVAAIGAFLVKPEFIGITNPHVVDGKLAEPAKAVGSLFGVSLNATFFGLPINIPSYAYSIFPIIFAAWLARPVGNWLKKHLPLVLRSIFQPLLTLLLVGAVVLVFVGPAITLLSQGISTIINWLLHLNYPLSGLIIGGLYQALVIFGLHWMVVPLIANEIAQTGHSTLNAIVNFTMIAQGAGALAVWAKTKIPSLKGLAGAGFLSAMAGITEPAMYGINLKYGRVFWMANIGGAVGGLIAGLFNLNMYGFTGSLIGFPSFAVPKGQAGSANNMLIFWVAAIATIAVAFLMVYFFGFKDTDTQQIKTVEKKNAFKDAVKK
ncbi:glucose PTS transporter subunit IIA [Leuconostoc citreum]|uniref:Phosphotransferase system IIC component, glucose/maltose/N-acetylglucosamine-specific n=1 Tax=Leuconostoc citreum (strain KM20) TaxID=349519 RepID=B1MVI1_LEUCK|nr:glucose PTS transporter subunit IIA [Leuconostoc citreum]ACA83235.1 Phosphotransferase system IIC component, glucose/maltose/N-acetylglucosamine-specific [Leuconostoc citreum KM20]MCT3056365.1 PTS beta-glucoside transporter subunit IIABC [Leuconostoc citreum]MCT3060734.1 PTS beta-glucoside transporter subunit IIABC [Leuconostoc citreum]MCT3073901.1 PTS beta-glucoside transporter subunit IIABC [Leuconostoc citreum]MCT3079401.1 PTS beta-glucoside transporter subunit IIABC [Leuconostoc citreum